MSDAPITTRNLDHFFGTGDARKQAIFDINLDIARGSLTILMGPSGSGKTTLLTLIGCLRDVKDGQVRVLGHELNGASEAVLVGLRRRLGFIFQAHNLHESLTATQNVTMGLQVHGRGDAVKQRKAAHHVLDLLGLADRRDYLPGNLSGGQKQRVAVARALVSNPEIILADEPTAALDKESGHTVVQMLKSLGKARGITTVMVTHDPRILEMADRIITLEDGRIISDELK
ncbi:ATP-binding cassette domain-containing protein [Octadecabacter sp. 1_MG-2023]|uniref:ATP-binding cassette domain-containing protein n=1 Tax=unclassified Octadecabacter TaxID=196158 RepID=UPI001C0840EA|nr:MULTISPECIES: ATP-binding cassette domain-containing protein [unclassified Octadecabacter]MBU2994400.1 ATP-binding cassette domain-containing protein [Octadecabacter sp. B2R22]MDO6734309.1 ATP-binding cassette domain-containing protein [Octadecabacter sp. 1_MG-2023]